MIGHQSIAEREKHTNLEFSQNVGATWKGQGSAQKVQRVCEREKPMRRVKGPQDARAFGLSFFRSAVCRPYALLPKQWPLGAKFFGGVLGQP